MIGRKYQLFGMFLFTLGIQVPSQKVFGVGLEGPGAF